MAFELLLRLVLLNSALAEYHVLNAKAPTYDIGITPTTVYLWIKSELCDGAEILIGKVYAL